MLKTSIVPVLASTLVLMAGCGGDDTAQDTPGLGGAPGSGGAQASGGSSVMGGAVATGGSVGLGGMGQTGGAPAMGGAGPTGGVAPIGGVAPTGGVGPTGGAATGGVAPTGGALTGGAPPTTGGFGTGGASTGGAATGGEPAGGSPSGGAPTGGASTGGASTGGASTGGAGTGGAATGGDGGTGGNGASECRVWLATDGDDSASGAQGSPVRTLTRAYDLVCPPPPSGSANGTECTGASPRTICVESGSYPMTTRFEFRKTRMGTASNRITLTAAPGASTKPVFDFSTQPRVDCGDDPSDGNLGGFTVNADYVTVRNVEVSGANDNCIKVQGSQGVIEGVVTHHCADAGIQISDGSGYTGSGTDNLILNSDSYQNNDTQCDGENADGFAAKEGDGNGSGNVFRGCRAWDNADDGWDLYGWAQPVRIENCWAVNQAATTEGSESDGNGFKLGGDGVSAQHVLVDLIAVGNTNGTSSCGFTENSNPAGMTCSGTCAAWGNGTDVDSIGGVSTSAIGNANISNMTAPSARNADGSLRSISSL